MDSETELLFQKFAISRPPRRPLPNPIVHLCLGTVMKKLFVVCTLGCVFACGAKNRAGDDSTSYDVIKTPATVEQAGKVLDLATFPLMDTAKPTDERHVANLSYLATGAVKKAFEFNRKAFVEQRSEERRVGKGGRS